MSVELERVAQAVPVSNRPTTAPAGPTPAPAPAPAPKVKREVAAPTESLQMSTRAVTTARQEQLGEAWKGVARAEEYRSDKPVPLEGYDAAKLANPDKQSPKYIFGRVAQGFKLDSVQGDKAKAEELLKAMVPDLRERGLDVIGVKGDSIQVKTELGYEWVDVVRGAGSKDPGWWWGSQGYGTPEPTASPKEFAARNPNPQNATAPSGNSMFGMLDFGASAPSSGNSLTMDAATRRTLWLLRAQGLEILAVERDRIEVRGPQGVAWVPVIRQGIGDYAEAPRNWLAFQRSTF